MRFWILLLRLTGALLIGFGVVGQAYFYTISRLSANGLFIAFVGDVGGAGPGAAVLRRRIRAGICAGWSLRNDQQLGGARCWCANGAVAV
ncbi:MAG: hypothetical protein IPK19_29740 [Chloroflexi bacterium]|nr:hypothetical protein [Chloroflexota bacterium]